MIDVSVDNAIARVTLRRPEKRNALTPDMLVSLRDAISRSYDDASAVLLSGDGKAFCAGFDLDLCRDDGPDQPVMRRFLTLLSEVILAMRAQPLPIVLCAHGAAVAGGAALLGGADIVVTDRCAKIGYPVTRLGISPAVSAPFLSQGVGHGACRARLLDSAQIDGAEAYNAHLAHILCDSPEEAKQRATDVVYKLTASEAAAVATKRWLSTIAPPNLAHEALETSRSLITGDEALDRLANVWKKP